MAKITSDMINRLNALGLTNHAWIEVLCIIRDISEPTAIVPEVHEFYKPRTMRHGYSVDELQRMEPWVLCALHRDKDSTASVINMLENHMKDHQGDRNLDWSQICTNVVLFSIYTQSSTDWLTAILDGRKIEAVKELKHCIRCTLLEAKLIVEATLSKGV